MLEGRNLLTAPVVTGLEILYGPQTGGTSVTIDGSDFTGATQVYFGSTPATAYTVNSDFSITATSPAELPGVIDVAVVTSAGTSALSCADEYSYLATPIVSSISPAVGPLSGATAVTITGSDLANATQVYFGAMAASSFCVIDDSTVVAYSPATSLDWQLDITVVVDDTSGTYTLGSVSSPASTADEFIYIFPPSISSVDPPGGSTAGGTSVTITGDCFLHAGSSPVSEVYFGTTPATSFTVNSTYSITAIAPALSGLVDITLVAPGGTSATSSADQVTYGTPAVTGLSATSGSTNGGNSATISGFNFSYDTPTVYFGSAEASSITVISDSSITAVAPAGAAGVEDVTVADTYGTSATSISDEYTYLPPLVESISVSSGSTSGGSSVTLSGCNFANATQVEFGSTAATSFTVTCDSSITAIAPAGYAGTVDITVSNAGDTSATSSADQFTYVAPVVDGISVTTGPTGGGTSVTISGSGFTNATQVYFGSVLAPSFTVNSDGSITATAPGVSAGVVDITVVNSHGASATSSVDQFTYVPPVVESVSPNTGSVAGGDSVTISGCNFTDVTEVYFGGTSATSFTVNSDTSITAISPALYLVTVDITVSDSYGNSATSGSDWFTYI